MNSCFFLCMRSLRTLLLSLMCLTFTLPASSIKSFDSIPEAEDAARQPDSRMASSGILLTGISEAAFTTALTGYERLREKDVLKQGALLTIIDFSLPSTEERMAVYDVVQNKVLVTSLVAHGRNSGGNMATSFSNVPQSYQSSLGFYRTAETYQGKHGYSLRLDGLEKGLNDRARERAIVMHGADYATTSFAKQHGRLGRSFGCPAVPTENSEEIINIIKGGHLLFIYGNGAEYATLSTVLNG